MTGGIVYSQGYDLYLPLLDRLHPFDGRKYSRAFQLLRNRFGPKLDRLTHTPADEPERSTLLQVHTGEYLDSLASAEVLARALEIPSLRLVPAALRESRLLHPMRSAVQGTVEAVALVLKQGGFIFHLGGGFHHAFAGHGEGFCVYADAAIAIRAARSSGLLDAEDVVLVIDLDSHRGNGIEDIFSTDASVRFFDMYNFQIYPGLLNATEDEEPYLIPLKSNTTDITYLEILREKLPSFLAQNKGARLAIYNAGTDVLAGDRLGQMALSEEGVRERDRFVIDSLIGWNIPAVVLPSGGYTSRSHVLIAETVGALLEACASPMGAR